MGQKRGKTLITCEPFKTWSRLCIVKLTTFAFTEERHDKIIMNKKNLRSFWGQVFISDILETETKDVRSD